MYTLSINEMVMNIVVISEREENDCYDLAAALYKKYGAKIFTDIFETFGEKNERAFGITEKHMARDAE